MSIQHLQMPKLGLTMTEGMLAEWMVSPGDAVTAGQIICVVETDKIANEIEATADGVIQELLVPEGDTVPVGTIIATFAGGPETTGNAVPVEAEQPAPAPAVTDAAAPVSVAHTAVAKPRVIATPLARRIAAQNGLDIATVKGTGPRGRIGAGDVNLALESPRAEPSVDLPVAVETSAPAADRAKPEAAPAILHPIGRYQAVAARRLTESKQTIPHFYITIDADITELLELRGKLNAAGRGPKATVNHFIVAAVVHALVANPSMNRLWAEGGLLEPSTLDVGLAVESPKGLVAPVISDLGASTLDDIVEACSALVASARDDTLRAAQLSGGVISVSNVGMFGASGLIPIVNPGQSSILGVGAAQEQFRPGEAGQPVLRNILSLTLSCDHRVVDGAGAARFLQSLKTGLESPYGLLRRPHTRIM